VTVKARTKKRGKAAAKPSKTAAGGRAGKAAGRPATAGRPGELFEALVAVQKRLLAPGGCPWDREQTHDTLRPYLIEEAYEVLDALDAGDAEHIAEELGDLLLQVVFHAQLGAQAGRFDISDVIEHIRNKLVRRHPHVFGDVKAETAAQVLKNWEELKAEEKRAANGEKSRKGGESKAAAQSALDGVPRTLPALLEGYQLSKKASKVGFDWRTAPEILDKLAEEAGELRRVLEAGDARGTEQSGGRRDTGPSVRREDELGDLLFVCVNLARFMGLDAEIALKKANLKFSRRFREMERLAAARGQQLAGLSSDKLEVLWAEAKGNTA
jgi:nucleoside triphosphate diphosphatase